MTDFVDSVRLRLLDELRSSLDGFPGRADAPVARADLVTVGKMKRAVVPRLGKVIVRFRVPAAGDERIWVGMWGWGEPRFVVETAHPGQPATPAVQQLLDAGFESWRDKLLSRYLPLDDTLISSATDLQDAVIQFSRASFDAIVVSGLLAVDADPSAAEVVAEEET
jgi:hypothetical protein